MASSEINSPSQGDPRFRLPETGGRSGAQQIAEQLRDAVANGSLRPGDKLPGEHELAASFDVARGTVREALKTLAANGLVRSTRGSKGGTFVTVPESEWVAEQLGDLLEIWFQVGNVTLAEVNDARGVLEHACVRRAALNRTEDDLAAMRRPVERSRDPEISDEEFIAADLEFHAAVSSAARNAILGLAMSAVHLARPRANRLLLRRLDRLAVADQHWAVYEAIRDRDADRAGAALNAHVAHLETVQRAALADSDPRSIPIADVDS